MTWTSRLWVGASLIVGAAVGELGSSVDGQLPTTHTVLAAATRTTAEPVAPASAAYLTPAGRLAVA